MRIVRLGAIVGALAWFAPAASIRAADAAPATMPSGAQVIDLKFVEQSGPSPRMLCGQSLDKDGKAELPFPNKAGKLILQYKNGRLHVDTNGDGVINGMDAKPYVPKEATIHVDATVAGKAVRYPLYIQEAQGAGQNGFLMLGPRGMLEGEFGGYTIRIADGYNMGRFDVAGTLMCVVPTSTRVSATVPAAYVPWSRTIDINSSLYQIELLGNGAQLKVTPYTGEVAEVTLQAPSASEKLTPSVTLYEESGAQVSALEPGQTKRLVPGKYRVDGTLIKREGRMMSYMGPQRSEKAKPFEAKAGQNVLKLGAPFSMQFSATRNGDQIDFTEAALLGCSGESYRPQLQEQNHDLFAAYVRVGEKETKLADLGFS